MPTEEKTKIQGKLIASSTQFEEGYYLKLFIEEQTTEDCIHIVYQGMDEPEKSYYKEFYSHFLWEKYPKLRLTINGHLEEDKMEYRGTGLIKIVS